MTRKLLALIGSALAVLMVSAPADPADAGGGGHSSSGARSFGGGSSYSRSQSGAPAQYGSRIQNVRPPQARPPQGPSVQYGYQHRPHGRRHRHILVGVPLVYGGYYYYGECDWLRRRALATGNPYWWNRYNACVYDGY